MYLIFINKIGRSWNDKYVYEFIFSDTVEVDGDSWDEYPANGMPSPPSEEYIKRVGRMEKELNLDVIQNDEKFSVWDAVDGIIALAWENINDYEEYPDNRLFFKFGEDIKSVEDKLYEKDIVLDYKFKKNERIEEQDKE
jgi:hypothetical protein